MLYRYEGLNRKARKESGFIHGDSKEAAIQSLKNEKNVVVVTHLKKTIDSKPLVAARTMLDKTTAQVVTKLMLETRKIDENKVKKLENRIEKKREKLYASVTPKEGKFAVLREWKEKAQKKDLKLDLSFLPKKKATHDEEVILDKDAYEELVTIFKKREEEFGELGQLTGGHVSVAPKEKEAEIDWSLIELDEADSPQSETEVRFKVKVKPQAIIMMTRRLQIMLSAGVSLINGLLILSEDEDEGMNKMINKILSDIQLGNTFSEAISQFPEQFDNTYVSLVAIGETSGNLASSLTDIIAMMEQKLNVQKKMKSAAIYPSIIGILLGAVMILGSIFFIPMFEDIFADLGTGQELPGLTQFVFKMADYIPWLTLIIGVGAYAFFTIKKKNVKVDRAWRKLTSRLALKIPVIRDVVLIYNMHTFAATVGMMVKNGVRLSNALLLAQKVTNNVYIKSEIARASVMMVNGYTLSEALREQTYFDNILINIIQIGEETGEMGFALGEIAGFYSTELDRRIENLMSLVQPVSMIAIGLLAAPVIVAIYMPILDMSSGSGM